MNIERFAGDNRILQGMAEEIDRGQAIMRRRQSEALQNAYEARARDVQATGVENARLFL